jgi:hypothetical protein
MKPGIISSPAGSGNDSPRVPARRSPIRASVGTVDDSSPLGPDNFLKIFSLFFKKSPPAHVYRLVDRVPGQPRSADEANQRQT